MKGFEALCKYVYLRNKEIKSSKEVDEMDKCLDIVGKELKLLEIIRNSKFNNEHFVDNLISYLDIQRPKDKDLLKEVLK